MKEVSLSGSVRTNVGKKDTKAVRNSGNVPCVVYGNGEQIHFNVKHVEMEKLIYTPNVYIINIDLDGKTVQTIIQDIQFHPVTDRIRHIDFIALNADKKVKINIPVNVSGRSIGVLGGGKMQQVFRRLKVYALPGNLPDSIEIDITPLKIGDAIRVTDVVLENVEILNAANAVICSVKMARGAADEDEEEEGATTEGAEGEEGEGEEGAEA